MFPEVKVHLAYVQMLKQMWQTANRWVVAANGQTSAYNNPVAKILARKLAGEALDQYFKAIDDLLPPEEKK